MDCSRIRFTVHALGRMFERRIGRDEAVQAVREGIVIQEYPEDTPHPSVLLWNGDATHPLHVVVAHNDENGECVVITVYIPEPHEWMLLGAGLSLLGLLYCANRRSR